MKSIGFLGECMVELRSTGMSTMHQSFAGDIYNAAVYLQRCYPQVKTHIVTALGNDSLSERMIARFHSENINTQLVFRHSEKIPGMYLIETDETGERSFLYWRDDAAAKQLMKLITPQTLSQLKTLDVLFFSGISLAILAQEDRPLFWEMIRQLKDSGVKVAFDPNYRERLWSSSIEAKEQFELAYQNADILLPGLEDMEVLYGIKTYAEAHTFFLNYQLQELIIKDGAADVYVVENDRVEKVELTPVTEIVDTTSAGDSFAGTYLGARMSGDTMVSAVKKASAVAGFVIQHPGAIVPKETFLTFCKDVI
jgi:2-dehydro-3-deoxygluconokinase